MTAKPAAAAAAAAAACTSRILRFTVPLLRACVAAARRALALGSGRAGHNCARAPRTSPPYGTHAQRHPSLPLSAPLFLHISNISHVPSQFKNLSSCPALNVRPFLSSSQHPRRDVRECSGCSHRIHPAHPHHLFTPSPSAGRFLFHPRPSQPPPRRRPFYQQSHGLHHGHSV